MSVREQAVAAFAHGDRAGLAEAARQADDTLRPAIACLRDVIAHRSDTDVADAPLPLDLVASLDRALDSGPPDPDLRIALLGIAVRHALAMADADKRPVRERVAACAGLVRLARDLSPRCHFLRSRAIIARLDIVLGSRVGDFDRMLRAVEDILGDPELAQDDDLRMEFTLQRLRVHLFDHALGGIEHDLAVVIGAAEHHGQRLGFDPKWLQDYYWYLSGDYRRIFATTTGTGWQACRSRRDVIHIYALLADGRFAEVESFLCQQRERLAREGVFDRRRSNQAVTHHELRTAFALAQRRFDDAREALRRCNAVAEDPHNYLSIQLTQAVAIELAAGQPQRARPNLELLDPDGTRGDCLVAWSRLLLLEGDREGAAQCFVRARERTSAGYLEHQFRFAHEVDAADALWLGRQRTAAPVRARSPVARRSAAGGAKLIGDSPVMARVRRQIATFAGLDQTVLISGETGTGKECVARLLHEQGAHPSAPFLALNCAALPDSLAESELFGHARGAFTGADRDVPGLITVAGEGTVFLDEIASMSMRLQAVLLRVLETGDYLPVGGRRTQRRMARVIVASNRPLTEAVSAGEFRADLYYRLARFTVDLPPLRERRADIPQLCRHFVEEAGGGSALSIDARLLARLQGRDWPGNVRELRNEIERLVVLAPGVSELADDELFVYDAPPTLPRPADGVESADPLPLAADPPAVAIPGVAKARRRRLQILALLRQHRQLSRAEVTEAFSCSPTTATGDLKVLQECGLIERIETSGHLRTSYFILSTA